MPVEDAGGRWKMLEAGGIRWRPTGDTGGRWKTLEAGRRRRRPAGDAGGHVGHGPVHEHAFGVVVLDGVDGKTKVFGRGLCRDLLNTDLGMNMLSASSSMFAVSFPLKVNTLIAQGFGGRVF